jgi:hypothetical protein
MVDRFNPIRADDRKNLSGYSWPVMCEQTLQHRLEQAAMLARGDFRDYGGDVRFNS